MVRDKLATSRAESSAWRELYHQTEQVERRRAQIPQKLARLNIRDVTGTSNSCRILDVGCGSGETLEALYGLGYRDLSGIDIDIPSQDLLQDKRFNTQVADALHMPFADNSFDLIVNIHVLHHFMTADRVKRFLSECNRVLKPGGRLAILDFPSSPQIRFAFWLFRQNWFLQTPYLKWFGNIIQEEWCFLEGYLQQWPQTKYHLTTGPLRLVSRHDKLFYYYLNLEKPMTMGQP